MVVNFDDGIFEHQLQLDINDSVVMWHIINRDHGIYTSTDLTLEMTFNLHFSEMDSKFGIGHSYITLDKLFEDLTKTLHMELVYSSYTIDELDIIYLSLSRRQLLIEKAWFSLKEKDSS